MSFVDFAQKLYSYRISFYLNIWHVQPWSKPCKIDIILCKSIFVPVPVPVLAWEPNRTTLYSAKIEHFSALSWLNAGTIFLSESNAWLVCVNGIQLGKTICVCLSVRFFIIIVVVTQGVRCLLFCGVKLKFALVIKAFELAENNNQIKL